MTICRVHLSQDVSSQLFVSQRLPKICGNQVEKGRAEWKYNIEIKKQDMSAHIQLKNTKLIRIGEACTFYFQFVKCQDFDSNYYHAYCEMRIILGQVV